MSGVPERTMLGARALRSVRVLDDGRTLLVELEGTERQTLCLFIPADLGLDLGADLMAAAARAKSERTQQQA